MILPFDYTAIVPYAHLAAGTNIGLVQDEKKEKTKIPRK